MSERIRMRDLRVSPISTDLVCFPHVKSDITLAGELEEKQCNKVYPSSLPENLNSRYVLLVPLSYLSGHTHDSYSVRFVHISIECSV